VVELLPDDKADREFCQGTRPCRLLLPAWFV
jgi:hypothetical protein